MPFVASADDYDVYNQELFNAAKNGDFGVVLPAIPVLSEAQEEVKKKITTKRDRLIQQGGCNVGGKWFHSDTHSKLQQLGLLIAGANLPAGLMWKTMDGSFISMTPTLAYQLYQAQMMQENAIFTQAEILKQYMMTLDDPFSLNVEVDWPVTYNS
jgi:hypothetical protein